MVPYMKKERLDEQRTFPTVRKYATPSKTVLWVVPLTAVFFPLLAMISQLLQIRCLVSIELHELCYSEKFNTVALETNTICCQWYILKPHFGNSDLPGGNLPKRVTDPSPSLNPHTQLNCIFYLSSPFVSLHLHYPSSLLNCGLLRVVALP